MGSSGPNYLCDELHMYALLARECNHYSCASYPNTTSSGYRDMSPEMKCRKRPFTLSEISPNRNPEDILATEAVAVAISVWHAFCYIPITMESLTANPTPATHGLCANSNITPNMSIPITFVAAPLLQIQVSEQSLAIHANSPATRVAMLKFKR